MNICKYNLFEITSEIILLMFIEVNITLILHRFASRFELPCAKTSNKEQILDQKKTSIRAVSPIYQTGSRSPLITQTEGHNFERN